MKRVVDKTIDPADAIRALQAGAMSWAEAQKAFAGMFLIGKHKGAPVALDITTLIEPLVWAEQLHILGNLDGATEDVDLQTITVPAGALATAVVTETLTVPTGEVWFINGVVGTCLADATGTIVYNWRCSLFPDAAGNVLGGVYHTAWIATPLGPQFDEFSAIATIFAIGNKPVPLRLPAGATISGQLMNAAGAAAATGVAGTMQLFGWRGKQLIT
jgi:hypothetical protein